MTKDMSHQIHQTLLNATQPYTLLNQAIATNGVQSLNLQPEALFFPYLARSVAGQQLSNQAAKTIWQRVEALLSDDVTLFDLFTEPNSTLLRRCGLSNAKVRTICGVRSALADKQIETHQLAIMTDEELIRSLTQLWGIGPWTAEMTAIFFFGRPNVWSQGDASLKRGLALFAEKENATPTELLAVAAPYHSYFALHVWQSLDTDFFTQMAG
ncbi:DNA-3-methyladenine glycosylase 2 family protein [Vibrio fluvialis]|uniref:DNA-3-methyladenine glycosylase family protein n=1 Tax=Vibrio fluvialis TaxID=676 RepID=UPI001C9C7FB0|nr:DNA-3-methyladenine glycosylase 2 family protein [Vibrio fluvialis]ELI1841179.1 DNA-3-methyladenine glycosylase 2 family protein [Vibrio fluvialis]MBY7903663.1 DNA-3-methyladenine glycosylase 2 family protein [Vibrio fluvialis]MBY7942331.1 DNA-3-methyladenine glycosylase 2 family protein [Vibrio fluvialis]MBY8168923.1 DNA-3-methyladenine glycosylase 2 family protein [Vibrio fluvialis]MCG6407259.1 DNA-3-methyladenine glycosylase 2 family protein [Vibrio fluvialis]